MTDQVMLPRDPQGELAQEAPYFEGSLGGDSAENLPEPTGWEHLPRLPQRAETASL